jgi:phenylacetate-CoA ligase
MPRPRVRDLVPLLARRDRLPDDLDAVVTRKLRWLLHHAATTVPWYRHLLREAGINPDRLGPEALTRLPVTRREDWCRRPASDFHSTAVKVRRCRWERTSGTTGAPVAIPLTLQDRIGRRIATQRCFWAAGVGLGDRYAWFRGPQFHRRHPAPHERLGVLRVRYFDLMVAPERYWEELRAWAPRGLLGFPLETQAVATRVRDRALPPLPSPTVWGVYGEPLEPAARAQIEDTLGPVREMYGSAECGTIAWECGQGPGLHVNADLVLVELLHGGKPVPPGTPGEVVVTSLHARAMPMVRYAHGDIGWEVPGPCPCGRPGPLLRVEPRFRVGPFRLPSGRRVSARFIVHVLPARDWLVRWQAEQPAPDALRLVLTVNRPVPAAEVRALADTIARALWEPVRVEVACRRPEEP